MTDADVGLRALETVGGLLVFGVFVIGLLGLVRRKRERAEAPVKKVPLWVRFGTLVGLAIAILLPAYLGPVPFLVVVVLLLLQATREFCDMLAAGGTPPHRWIALLAAGALPIAAWAYGMVGLLAALGALVPLALLVALARGDLPGLPARAGGLIAGMMYLGFLGSFMVLLRAGDGGFGRVLFFIMVIQLADVFGLVGGLAFGKRQLAPTLSPGKTWEGTVGSAIAGMAGAALFQFGVPALPLPMALAAGLALFLAGLFGDLLASGFKRAVGLKDFGTLLPGHGGVLDRFDGYFPAAPLALLLFTLMGLKLM